MRQSVGGVRTGAAALRFLGARRRNKLGARRVPGLGGRMYDSQAERDYRAELELLLRAGAIMDLVEQPRLEIEPGVFYRPDFGFIEKGRPVYVDVKGYIDHRGRFPLICKLWRLHMGAVLRIVKRERRGRSFVVVKEILPEGAVR